MLAEMGHRSGTPYPHRPGHERNGADDPLPRGDQEPPLGEHRSDESATIPAFVSVRSIPGSQRIEESVRSIMAALRDAEIRHGARWLFYCAIVGVVAGGG